MPDRPDGSIEVIVNLGDFPEAPESLIAAGVQAVLDDAEVDAAEVSVTLLDDAAIRGMNAEYLDRDRVTDVIAFSLGDDAVLGDIYLGVEQARRQAGELGESLDRELVRLAIHGALHVLGHDHPEGPERVDSPMFALQERLLESVSPTH